MIGSVFGPYTLEEELGQGTLGANFRAVDSRNGRRLVLKLLRPELKGSDGYRELLFREVNRLKALKHRHIAQFYELFEDRGELCVVQELVRGHTLLQEMDYRGGSLPLPRIYTIFRQILSAVGHAHSAGILHLALNPNKIMISRNGEEDRIKLLDFGLGPFHSKGSDQPGFNVLEPDVQQGFYLSPEQLHKTMSVSPRSDLYSIGILLYEGATGYVPFGADNIYGVIRGHLLDRPETPSSLQAEVPWYLSATILKALAKHPEDRFDDARDFGYHIIACQTGAVISMATRKVKVARVKGPSPEDGQPQGSNGAARSDARPAAGETDARTQTPRVRSEPRPDATRFVQAIQLPDDDQVGEPVGESVPQPVSPAVEEAAPDEASTATLCLDDSNPNVAALPGDATSTLTGLPPMLEEPQPPPPASLEPAAAAAPDGRIFAKIRQHDPGQPLLPRGLAPRSPKPLPEGLTEPSFLVLLQVRPAAGAHQPAEESISPLAAISKLGLTRTGFKRV